MSIDSKSRFSRWSSAEPTTSRRFTYAHTLWDYTLGYAGNFYFYDVNAVYDPDALSNWYWIETTGPFNTTAKADHPQIFIQDVYKPITTSPSASVRASTSRSCVATSARRSSMSASGARASAPSGPMVEQQTKIVVAPDGSTPPARRRGLHEPGRNRCEAQPR